MARYMLEQGTDPHHVPLRYPLRYFMRWPCKALIAADANPNLQNSIGDIALHTAAEKGRFEIFQILLQAGGNPTLKNDEGQMALDLVSSATRSQFEAALLKSTPYP